MGWRPKCNPNAETAYIAAEGLSNTASSSCSEQQSRSWDISDDIIALGAMMRGEDERTKLGANESFKLGFAWRQDSKDDKKPQILNHPSSLTLIMITTMFSRVSLAC
jgi:hypothetical protein